MAATISLLNAGYENFLARTEVDAILRADSAPVRRMVQQQRSEGRLLDMTAGRRMRSVVRLKSGTLVIAALTSETLARRLAAANTWAGTPPEAAE